jgi:hypothetical protein
VYVDRILRRDDATRAADPAIANAIAAAVGDCAELLRCAPAVQAALASTRSP